MPDSPVVQKANLDAFLAAYNADGARYAREAGGRLVDTDKEFVDFGGSRLTWSSYPTYRVSEKLGLLELGIRAGLFPEDDDRYHEDLLSVPAVEVIGPPDPSRRVQLLDSFERRASSSFLGEELPKFDPINPTSYPAAVALFEDTRQVLDYLDAEWGRAAVELALGRSLIWTPGREETAEDLYTNYLLDSIEHLRISVFHENAIGDYRRDPERVVAPGATGTWRALPAGICLFLFESFLCLDDVLRMMNDIQVYALVNGAQEIDTNLATLASEAKALISELELQGQEEQVVRGVAEFFGGVRTIAEKPEQASAFTVRPSMTQSRESSDPRSWGVGSTY